MPEALGAAAEGPAPSIDDIALSGRVPNEAQSQRFAPRILIVDDDATTGHMLARLLTFHEFTAISVQSGAEGLRLALSGACDALVLDLQLPDVPGLSVLAQLRIHDAHVPVIPITGQYFDAWHRRRAEALGISDYLYKPLTDDTLAQALRRAIGGSRILTRSDGEHATVKDIGAALADSDGSELPGTNEILALVLPEVQRRAQRAYPRMWRDAVVDAVDDAALEWATRADSRAVPWASLVARLVGAAKRNLANAWRSEKRRQAREDEYARANMTISHHADRDPEHLERLRSKLLACASDKGERLAILLWLRDAPSNTIAKALGCTDLDPAARQAAVARFKDRLAKRARRRMTKQQLKG